LFDLELEETCIFYDNQSCINFPVKLVCHDELNHIEIKYHYIREMIENGVVNLQYVLTDEQVADVLLACFIGRVCLSLMARTTTTMANRKKISSGGEVNNMQRSKLRRESAVQKCDQDQILDRGYSSRFFMTVGSL
jgi:hypothetical protein